MEHDRGPIILRPKGADVYSPGRKPWVPTTNAFRPEGAGVRCGTDAGPFGAGTPCSTVTQGSRPGL